MALFNRHHSDNDRARFLILIIALFIGFAAQSAHADQIDIFLEAQMAERNIPAIQLAIIKDGEVVKLESYGTANIQDNIATTNDTVFPLNSITKAFVGVAVMQLVEQGKVDIDAGVGTYLSDLPEAWKHITIKQMFSHVSGLPEILRNDGKLVDVNGQGAAWKMVTNLPMEFETGTNFRYNQTGLVIIGKVIEAVSGVPFADFIINNQLKIVGMPKTIQAGFTHFEGIVPNQARNYTFYKGGVLTTVQEEFPPILRTAAGMSSTAAEISKWLIALNNGELISLESLKILWTPTTLADGKTAGFNNIVNGYAIGWPMIVRPDHPAAVAIGGNRTVFGVYPDDNLSIVILTNLMGGLPDQFIDEVAGFYIPEMKIENGFGLSDDLNKLRVLLDKNGYDKALEMQNTISAELGEEEINAWGYKLINGLMKQKAVEIFKLNTILFPNSANTYDSLADSYARVGDKEMAIKNYNKVLQLEPKNQNAPYQLNLLSLQ
mgnify:CR=1 FL=1